MKSTPSNSENTMKHRLLQLLKAKNISQTEFTRRLGVTPTYIGAMRKGMPQERLKVVFEMFPDLNRDWLVFGEGEMFRPEEDGESVDLSKGYMVPMLPVEAYAGNLQNWSSGVLLRDCDKVVSPVPGVDFGIRVTGNSMEPEFQNGSVLFIKRINEKSFIPWGNPMVIDTDNGVVVKVVYPPRNEEAHPGCITQFIEARSYNPDYPPFLIPTDSIFGLYRIITSIRQYSTL